MLFSFSKLTQQLEIVALAVEAKTITEVERFKMLNKRNAIVPCILNLNDKNAIVPWILILYDDNVIVPWIARTTVATVSEQKAKTRHCLSQIGQ